MSEKRNIKLVGLITMHRVVNYGSFLQAYATQRVIENLGHKCEIIDYVFPNIWQYQHGLKQRRNLKWIISEMIFKLGITSGHRKRKIINQAIHNYLKLSDKKYFTPTQISENPPSYDVYITGSDQTWNPKHTKGDTTFLLSFTPNGSKKISFSASIAGKNMDEEYKKIFSPLLKEYNAISIRDENGNSIINELTGKDATITLDPTLILNHKEWSTFGQNRRIKYTRKKYIVFYLITHSFDPTPYIFKLLKFLQVRTGLMVYSFSKIPDNYEIEYCLCEDITVESYIQLFESASYVVTSSFHGTAFAVNFGIPLFSVVNELNGSDDRQASLLSRLGIENCLVPVGKSFDDISPSYDVETEQEILNTLRGESINYLENSIYD